MIALSLWHWFALALLLGILELVLGGNFIFLACGLAALVTGIVVGLLWFMTIEYQFLVFGLNLILSFIVWRHFFKKKTVSSDTLYLNQRGHQYLNRYFTLEDPIINGRGRVRVDDTIWSVEGEDLPKGTRVQVVGVDGTILKVKKAGV